MEKLKMLVCYSYAALLLILISDATARSHYFTETRFTHQESDTTLVVYYVKAVSCSFSSQSEVIEAAKRIPEKFKQFHDRPVRYVFVSMDQDLDQSLEFMRKHGEGWDEVSLGARYHNENLLKNFNSLVDAPGTPYIMVFKDVYSYTAHNIPQPESRKKLTNILGADGVIEWVEKCCPIEGIE